VCPALHCVLHGEHKGDGVAIAIYPGTFDPVHYGHIDVATRAATILDQLTVAVYDHGHPLKSILFSAEERVAMMKEALRHLPNVLVESYSGLTVEYARTKEARVIVRGLRVTYDFEFEYQRALTNKKLAPEIETVSLMTSLEYAFLSSSMVKEIVAVGGCVQGMVPPHVEAALRKRTQKAGAYGTPI
jgi:pantetheine-phosphate adenylyltransferase